MSTFGPFDCPPHQTTSDFLTYLKSSNFNKFTYYRKKLNFNIEQIQLKKQGRGSWVHIGYIVIINYYNRSAENIVVSLDLETQAQYMKMSAINYLLKLLFTLSPFLYLSQNINKRK